MSGLRIAGNRCFPLEDQTIVRYINLHIRKGVAIWIGPCLTYAINRSVMTDKNLFIFLNSNLQILLKYPPGSPRTTSAVGATQLYRHICCTPLMKVANDEVATGHKRI